MLALAISGKRATGLLEEGHGDLRVGALLHDFMVQNEAVLVFDHGHPQPELDRHAGLALADPRGVRREDGEDLLGVGDALALQHPPADLIALALAMGDVVIEGGQQRRGQAVNGGEPRAGVSRARSKNCSARAR
jgi:hypothetical protein